MADNSLQDVIGMQRDDLDTQCVLRSRYDEDGWKTESRALA